LIFYMTIQNLFEEELKKRGLPFKIDAKSGRHVLEVGGCQTLVSLEIFSAISLAMETWDVFTDLSTRS
jgi:hypothetical protein